MKPFEDKQSACIPITEPNLSYDTELLDSRASNVAQTKIEALCLASFFRKVRRRIRSCSLLWQSMKETFGIRDTYLDTSNN